MPNPSLAQRVEQALNDELDFDTVWAELSAAVDEQPADPEPLRLRLQLAEAAGLREQRLADLQRLSALLPGDRALRRELAFVQHRLALWLGVEPEDDDEPADDKTAPPATTVALQQQALAWCDELAAAHVADAEFMLDLLGHEDSPLRQAPWLRLRWLLQAVACSPDHAGLARLQALAWADLAGWLPADWSDDQPLPMGFVVDAFGSMHEARMLERGLLALAPLIEAAPQDTELREARAALWAACGRFADAALDHTALAEIWSDRAACATDDDERDACQARADEARTQAGQCAAGRAAVVQASLQGIDQALGRWEQLDTAADDERPNLPEDLRDALAEHRAEADQRREGLRAQFEQQLRPAVEAAGAGPDAETLAAMEAQAVDVAARLGGLLAFDPVQVIELSSETLEAPLDPWLLATGETMQAAGWRWLGWCENPAWRPVFGRQVVTGLWVDAEATSLAAASSTGTLRVVDLESEFASGAQLVTTSTRGKSNFGGGPLVDQLALDANTPLALMLTLHQARVAEVLASRPGESARRFDSVAAFAAMQERQRQAKQAFRLAEGLGEFEALGVPTDHPDQFAPLLRRAAREQFAVWARERA